MFNEDEENYLHSLTTASKYCHGLTSADTFGLAFQYTKKNNKTISREWETNVHAGRDWF